MISDTYLTMAVTTIEPIRNSTSASFRQSMSWIIKEEDWDKDERVYLELINAIPGTYKLQLNGWKEPYAFILINRELYSRQSGLKMLS